MFIRGWWEEAHIRYGQLRKPTAIARLVVQVRLGSFLKLRSSVFKPSLIRHKMYKRDDTADMLVKCWLSLFSLSRIILVAKKIDKSLFESIISPPVSDPDWSYIAVNRVAEVLPQLIARYTPWISHIPLLASLD